MWRMGGYGENYRNVKLKGYVSRLFFSLYRNIKSCVEFNNKQSEFFPCLTGVRQGEHLLPFLFSIFLNDIEEFV